MDPLTRLQRDARPESMLLNMGPSHPAMHGTIRVMLELDAEKILNAEVEVGYLHRGFEKTCENKTYFNLLIYTDRLNYVSPLINNLGYVMTMEKMLGVAVPERAQLIRVLMSELSRVSDHLTCLAAMAMESGAFTVFLYMMKAREYLWDVIEFTTGARLTTSYIRIGGVRADLHAEWRGSLATAIRETRKVLKDVSGLLDKNSIFLGRTRGVGVISQADALSYGWTGPCLRSTGIPYDVRKASPYLVYDRLSFEVPVGEFGDNYDRYSVRMREMEQSLRLLEQVAALIPDAPPLRDGPVIEPAEAIRASRRRRAGERIRLSPNLEGSEKERLAGLTALDPPASVGSTGGGVGVPSKEDTYTTMEGLISHFLFFMKGKGIRPPKGDVYFSVEGGNGELGFYIVSDGTDRPYRLHLRGPCFHIVSALEQLIKGRLIADVIPTFGSMNMIGGELDR
jgi:NADH-quinone oxidoreductase subunit D